MTYTTIFKPKNVEEGISIIRELLNLNKEDSLKIFNYVFDEPYNHLDIDLVNDIYYKNFNKLEIKLNIQNILAQDQIFYFKNNDKYVDQRLDVFESFANTIFTGDYENKDGYSPNVDDTLWITKYGRTFSLSLSYNF